MSFIYTRTELKSRINAGIHNKQGMIIDFDALCNQVVRKVFATVDFQSARRKVALTPSLYNGVFDYFCPTDLSENKLIDIPAQAGRKDGEFFMVPPSEFDIYKPKVAVAIDDFNGTRVLKVNSQVDSKSIVISELDSLTASSGSTWAIFGDAENLTADTDDYVRGNGSLSFDLSAAGGTTAGIQNTALSSTDISEYLGGTSSIFVWAKINSPTDLTNYILRIGQSTSHYYSKTITTQHDGTAFVAGWNLLRFDLTSLTSTGTPDATAIQYVAVYMTKTAGKVSETDYKFDYLVLKRGVIHDVKYYTKYGWQSSAGAYKAASTDDLDVLVAYDDEFELLVTYGIMMASKEVKEYEIAEDYAKNVWPAEKKDYQNTHPSEAKIISTEYYAY